MAVMACCPRIISSSATYLDVYDWPGLPWAMPAHTRAFPVLTPSSTCRASFHLPLLQYTVAQHSVQVLAEYSDRFYFDVATHYTPLAGL
eukprot:scaffold78145_cov36-Prasinocladus_malaysianus.AAC.1